MTQEDTQLKGAEEVKARPAPGLPSGLALNHVHTLTISLFECGMQRVVDLDIWDESYFIQDFININIQREHLRLQFEGCLGV